MAGLDYSKVVEPDYDAEKTKQTPGIMDWIKRTGETVLSNWAQREKMKADLLARKKIDERTRNIYYDTDNIGERQRETIRACPDCAGALKIASSSDRGVDILAIHIPFNACTECVNLAYQWYESANASDYDHIYLQDRKKDLFLVRNDTK